VRFELNLYVYYAEESRPPLWSSGQSSWLHNGDVLSLLWGTNWIHTCYVEESRPPLWSSGQSSWLQNGDVLCFLWGTNWIYIRYVEESRQTPLSEGLAGNAWEPSNRKYCFRTPPPTIVVSFTTTPTFSLCLSLSLYRSSLWSSGQSSWPQIHRSGFDSRRYQIFWQVVGLERGPLSLMSTTEELLDRKSSGSGLCSREYGRGYPPRRPYDTIYPQKLALTSQTRGCRSVSIVWSRTQATELSLV
jgi:hypothetical protein